CFFFSSKRRHTSFLRDWSSDVCSSNLSRTATAALAAARHVAEASGLPDDTGLVDLAALAPSLLLPGPPGEVTGALERVAGADLRSEERRGGKEGRCVE